MNLRPLSEYAELISRGIAPKYSDEGYIVLNQRCIRDYLINYALSRKTSINSIKNHNKILKKWDVLINSTGVGTLGRVAQYKGTIDECTVDSHITIVRPDISLIDGKFFGYCLRANQKNIEEMGEGATGQTELSRKRLSSKILIPNFESRIQQQITDILSAYDDLIENNNRRIELLEQAAQQIFIEWFVRFRFPGYESAHLIKGIPEGWEVKRISEIVEVIDGDRGTNYPNQNEMFDEGFCLFLNAGNVTKNGLDYSSNTFITKEKDSKLRKGKLNRDDIVITTRGTVGNVALYNRFVPYDNVRINSGMVIVRPINSDTNVSFLYLLLRSSSVQQLISLFSSGSAQPQLPIKDMKRIKVLFPSKELLTAFEVVVKPILDSISSSKAKNQNLIKQRDLLLPRLMSGKLEVKR